MYYHLGLAAIEHYILPLRRQPSGVLKIIFISIPRAFFTCTCTFIASDKCISAPSFSCFLHPPCLSPQGFAAIASLLLSNGANPGAKTFRQLTPLHLACHQGHPKVARLVLEAWAPVDDRDEAGTAPLHLCAQMGHGEVVRLLLQCGANKDARDESGWTPIFFASWKGHAAVARLLLQAGADARVSFQVKKFLRIFGLRTDPADLRTICIVTGQYFLYEIGEPAGFVLG